MYVLLNACMQSLVELDRGGQRGQVVVKFVHETKEKFLFSIFVCSLDAYLKYLIFRISYGI